MLDQCTHAFPVKAGAPQAFAAGHKRSNCRVIFAEQVGEKRGELRKRPRELGGAGLPAIHQHGRHFLPIVIGRADRERVGDASAGRTTVLTQE